MSGLTPAERLREAARVLRERGEPEDSSLGLALADWLDDEAATVPAGFSDEMWIAPTDPAMRVADAVLGEP